MVKKIEVNISNKFLYSAIALFAILVFGIGVYAYGGNSPSVVGHTMSELQSSCTGLLRWTGSAWACIPLPPTCTGTNNFLHWSGSSWSCESGCTNTCTWVGGSSSPSPLECQMTNSNPYYNECLGDPASYTTTVTWCVDGCVTSSYTVVRCPLSHLSTAARNTCILPVE